MILIRHTPTTGTLVYGTRSGDGAAVVLAGMTEPWRVLRPTGLERVWYLPGSRGRDGDPARVRPLVEALESDGYPVAVSLGGVGWASLPPGLDPAGVLGRRLLRHRQNPGLMARRIRRLGAALDRARRRRRVAIEAGEDAEAERLSAEATRLAVERAIWREDWRRQEFKLWDSRDLRPGDEVLVSGAWYPVVRVNARTVTITPTTGPDVSRPSHPSGRRWSLRVGYDRVEGRRRDGNVLNGPPPGPGHMCGELVEAARPNPGADEGDGYDWWCAGEPALRVTVLHDGLTCGCGTACQEEPDAPPWPETRLLCAEHAHHYRDAHEEPRQRVTVENLP